MSSTSRIKKNISNYNTGSIVAIRIQPTAGIVYIDFRAEGEDRIRTQRFGFTSNSLANEINRSQLEAIFGSMKALCLEADKFIGTTIRWAVQAVVTTESRTFEDYLLLPGSNAVSEEAFATLLVKASL